jgi:hypothetical protein
MQTATEETKSGKEQRQAVTYGRSVWKETTMTLKMAL